MLKKLLSLFALAGLLLGIAHAEPELRDDHPDQYTVQPGDTLWDISSRFLKSPWLWPEIWQANPQVENPHLIYPGDVLSLVYIGGRPTLVKLSPRIRSEDTGPAVQSVPLSAIEPFLKRMRLLNDDEFRTLPYVVAVEENRIIGHDGTLIYVRGLERIVADGNLVRGMEFAIVRPTVIYREFPPRQFPPGERKKPTTYENEDWSLETVNLKNEGYYWRETLRRDPYWDKVRILGREVLEIGQGQLTVIGDPSSVLITRSDREIKDGDLLLPLTATPFDLTFYPNRPTTVPSNTRVLAVADPANFYGGPMDVVAISRGAADGVEVGDVMSIYRPGERIRDEVAHPQGSIPAIFKRKHVTLPDEYAGHVMVFRTFGQMSYGVVMDQVKPVRVGHLLKAP